MNSWRVCHNFALSTSTAAAKLRACIADLPSTGGVADASGLDFGNLNLDSDPFTAVTTTKAVTVIWPSAILNGLGNMTFPAGLTVDFPNGGGVTMSSGKTLTITGEIRGTISTHFSGSGTVSFTDLSNRQIILYPEWFGAVGDGVTDDTTALQAVLNNAAFSITIQLSAKTYAFTTLRLKQATTLKGAGLLTTTLTRIGVGSGGSAMDMTSGQNATGLHLMDFAIDANHIGSTLNGLELGTQVHGTTDLAIGSSLENLFVKNATGTAYKLFVNVAQGQNLWAWTSLVGFDIDGTAFYGYNLNPEGNTNEDVIINAKATQIYGLQTEGDGIANAATDVVHVTGPDVALYGVWSNHAVARRSVVGTTAAGTNLTAISVHREGAGPGTTVTDSAASGLTISNADVQFYSNGPVSAQRNIGIGQAAPAELIHATVGATGNNAIRLDRNSQAMYIGITDADYILTGMSAGDSAIRCPAACFFGSGGNNVRMKIAATGAVSFNGTATNDSASAGQVGEIISSVVATGSSVALATGSATPITSISLTAGDWDVSGVVDYTLGATTSVTIQGQGIQASSSCMSVPVFGGTQDQFTQFETPAAVPTNTVDEAWAIPVIRLSLASTTTVCLNARATFSASTLRAYGTIRARRVR